MYSWDKGIHGIFVNPTKYDATTWIDCQCQSQEVVHIGQTYDTLHVDLFNSICQKSNNEKMTLPKDTHLSRLLDNK